MYRPHMEATYTVAELSGAITRAVARAFPEDVWVEGEIRDLSRARNGHVYFVLVDPEVDTAGTRLPVTLFASDRQAVNRVLVRTGAVRMTDGVRVRIRGRVSHYAARGTVQLRMTWIDTDYTLGRLAAERRDVIRRLEAAGLLDRNGALAIPELPLRIGLVTSRGSAAEADFITELRDSRFGFRVLVCDTRVQGPEAPAALEAALMTMGRRAPDIVAVIRGGGAQTDLAAFDTEMVARAIALATFPVVTGIGHEIDDTVADRVAARSFKTPTACAQSIVALVRDADGRLRDRERRLAAGAVVASGRASSRLETATRRLTDRATARTSNHSAAVAAATARLRRSAPVGMRLAVLRLGRITAALAAGWRNEMAAARRSTADAERRLRRTAPRALAGQRRHIEALDALRRAAAPVRMLARGWSITHDGHGRLVRSAEQVSGGDALVTTTSAGRVRSIVTEEAR